MFGERTCSHCHGTFDRKLFGINLLTKRYERCPHCHKFTETHYVLPASPEDVRTAHDAPLTEEEALRKRIEDSKYEGHL